MSKKPRGYGTSCLFVLLATLAAVFYLASVAGNVIASAVEG